MCNTQTYRDITPGHLDHILGATELKKRTARKPEQSRVE